MSYMHYEDNDDQTGRLNTHEMCMLRDLLIAPYMLDLVDVHKGYADRSGAVLRKLNGLLAETLMDIITQDLSDLRTDLRSRQIKTWEMDQDHIALYVGYNCRGYSDKFGMTKEAARGEIRVQLGEYMGDVIQHLRVLPKTRQSK
ncbi:hypothetical protein [Cohnella sp. 56]|uniref:hypothetical protein n=1 Tax=Cohnella sp. 56 TaxID=3113722 RepID=UPI0030E86CC3